MTEYYRKLDAVAQSRYLEKLKLLGLEEKDDPYEASNSCNFIDDMTKWPSVEYGRIFCYYIQRPGVYSRQQLMQWKSLEAFKYFSSGHVRQIKVWPLSSCRKTVETEAFFLPTPLVQPTTQQLLTICHSRCLDFHKLTTL